MLSAFADFFNGDPPFEAAFTLIFFPVAEVVARAFDVLALVAGFEGATGTGCNDFDTVPDFPTLDIFFFRYPSRSNNCKEKFQEQNDKN